MKGRRLTAAHVRNAKKSSGDGNGLWLMMPQRNGKLREKPYWLFRYMLRGKRGEIRLGPADLMTLAEAREAHQRLLKILKVDRVDPRGTLGLPTFGDAHAAYLAAHKTSWRGTHTYAEWSRLIRMRAEALLPIPCTDIDTALLLKVLRPLWSESPKTAMRLRTRIERVLAFAAYQGWRSNDNPARWRNNLEFLLPRPSRRGRHRALSWQAVPSFISGLDTSSVVHCALIFTILTASQVAESCRARWDEIDMDRKLWIIAAQRMKAGREHRVPLSEPVLVILRQRMAVRIGDGMYVFPGIRRGNNTIHTSSLWHVCDTASTSVHGFRSSFRNYCADNNVPHEITEMALANAAALIAYCRPDTLEQRRRIMDQWGAHCMGEPRLRRLAACRDKGGRIAQDALERCHGILGAAKGRNAPSTSLRPANSKGKSRCRNPMTS